MYNKVYEKKEFIIFQVKNDYIAYNTKKYLKIVIFILGVLKVLKLPLT